jgi:hypothetical protein
MTCRARTCSLLLAATISVPGGRGEGFTETFESDPASAGWQIAGDASLFRWDAVGGALEVTWDSSRPNSLFYHPLQNRLTAASDFEFAFDLRPARIEAGVDPGKPGPFQMAVGLVRLADALAPGFIRGTGTDPRNLVEWDYFPDTGFGATVSPAIVTSTRRFAASFTFPLELDAGAGFHVHVRYTSATRSLVVDMNRNGEPVGPVRGLVLPVSYGDFEVDALAIASWSDEGQDPSYPGSLLAQGRIDNVDFASSVPGPLRISGRLTPEGWEVRGQGIAGWWYRLERSRTLDSWEPVGDGVQAVTSEVVLWDHASPDGRAFYRLAASATPP